MKIIDIATIYIKNILMNTQIAFDGFNFQTRMCFGGSLLKQSHAKVARPLTSKQATHFVMTSKYAQGSRSLLKHDRWIKNLSYKLARKRGIKIYKISNNGRTLSILLKFSKRKQFLAFSRALSGLIARKTLNAEKGRARRYDTAYKNEHGPNSKRLNGLIIAKGERFWDQRPFTRIVSWGPDYNNMKNALGRICSTNGQMAIGFLPKRHVKALGSHLIYAKVLNQIQKLITSNSS